MGVTFSYDMYLNQTIYTGSFQNWWLTLTFYKLISMVFMKEFKKSGFVSHWAKFMYGNPDHCMNQLLPIPSVHGAMMQIRTNVKVSKFSVAKHHCTWTNTYMKDYF